MKQACGHRMLDIVVSQSQVILPAFKVFLHCFSVYKGSSGTVFKTEICKTTEQCRSALTVKSATRIPDFELGNFTFQIIQRIYCLL